MEIGTQKAGNITNIDNLNGNFRLSLNAITFKEEVIRTESEIVLLLSEMNELLKGKGIEVKAIKEASEKIKNDISDNDKDGIFDSIKHYLKTFNETMKNSNEFSDEMGKLVKLGTSIGKYLALISIV